jgi:hypothetical protein
MSDAPASAQRRPGRSTVLADGWYSWLGTEAGETTGEGERGRGGDGESAGSRPWVALTTVVGSALPAPLADRVLGAGWLRGLALGLLSSRYRAVAIIRYDRGWRTLLLVRALFGRRRKLVVFQFFDHPPVGASGRLWRRIDRWALRRSLAVAQVLTASELESYPAQFGIPAERFRLIRFAARTAPRGSSAPRHRENGPVVAAGRAHCDWPTLFAAAGGRGWDLQVVCSAEDHAQVSALNTTHRAGAQISSELPHAATHALLSHAAISVICVTEGLIGRGHIRLAEAADTGATVVASDVASLRGYVQDGITAVLVPSGDPDALRAAVEDLLRDPARRASLAADAFAIAAAWTGPDYVAALQALAGEAASAVV